MGTWEDGMPRKALVWKETPEPARAEGTYIFKISQRDAWAKYGEPTPDAAPPAP